MTFDTVPSGHATRGDLLVIGSTALASLVLSPITAVWAVVLGLPLAAAGWVLRRRTRTVWLVAVGVLLGTVPYFALAVVQALLA